MDDAARKRPRPVVSCLRCRDKKLKCDRAAPCQNCVKGQCATTCTYQQWPGNASTFAKPVLETASSTSDTSSPDLVEDLQARLAKLEELLGVQSAKAAPSTKSSSIRSTTSTEQNTSPPTSRLGMVVAKGNRTIYHGQNDRITLLNQFTDVKHYLKESVENEQLKALGKQVQFLQKKTRPNIASPDASEAEFSLSLLKLREFLPPKPYCDRLVAVYFQHFERTMRVLHMPTFMRQYDQIWANTDPDICSSSTTIPQVTTALTMAYHLDGSMLTNEDEVHLSYLKGAAIDLVQSWLDELGRKRRTELSTLQVEILLLLTRSLRQIDPGRLWSSTGALVRSAMAMGFHMNLSDASKISLYHAEMRRRLWATILEMDLQASMFSGMPIFLPDLDSIPIPANVDDSEFDESSTEMPASKPLNTLTDNTYQVYLASSLLQRCRALSLAQHHFTPPLDEVVKQGRIIEEHLSRKPPALELDRVGADPIDAGSLLHSVLMDLYIRRPLLCLYRPLLSDERWDQRTFVQIRDHCSASALMILSYQDLNSSQMLTKVLENPSPQQDFFYRCCKSDLMWAALCVCQHLKLIYQASMKKGATQKQIGELESSYIETVERTIDFMIQRLAYRDSDLKDIIFLTIALRLTQLSGTPSENTKQIQEVTRNTLLQCRETLMASILTEDQAQSARIPKRAKVTVALPTTMMPQASLPPPTTMQPQYTSDHTENVDQWLGDMTDLAVEFSTFQGHTLASSGDTFHLDVAQDWNWDYMWH